MQDEEADSFDGMSRALRAVQRPVAGDGGGMRMRSGMKKSQGMHMQLRRRMAGLA